jgi:predicted phosphoribosyltransferase
VGYEVATALGAPLDVFVLGVPRPDIRGATVVLVDDGVASGSTMLAAVHALRELRPAAVVVAAPVMSPSARAALASFADVCESIVTPEPLLGVGMWYHDFTQTTEDEVRRLLPRATRRTRSREVRYAGRS